MDQLGPNALGETLEPGRVADCYLGLLLPPGPAGEPEPGTVLIVVPAAPLICIHGAHVQGGGLRAQGVAIVPSFVLRSALGCDQVLSELDVERYAATARMRLRPAS